MPSALKRLATASASGSVSPATKREDRRWASAEVSIQRRKRAWRERKSRNSRTFQDTMRLRACRNGGKLPDRRTSVKRLRVCVLFLFVSAAFAQRGGGHGGGGGGFRGGGGGGFR